MLLHDFWNCTAVEIDHRQLASGVRDILPQADVHLWTRNLVKLLHSCHNAVELEKPRELCSIINKLNGGLLYFLRKTTICFVSQKFTILGLNILLQTGHICFGGLSGPWGLLWQFRTFETWRFASTAVFIYHLQNQCNILLNASLQEDSWPLLSCSIVWCYINK